MILRTVEYFTSHSLEMLEECSTSAAKGNGQKSMPPPRRRGSVQQGRSLFDAWSVLSVREPGKKSTCLREALRRRQGTPLEAFFNIPILRPFCLEA